jgi:hypothetical protein
VAIDDALQRLAEVDPRVEDTAAALNISGQSVMRDWRLAKSWLMREMGALAKS